MFQTGGKLLRVGVPLHCTNNIEVKALENRRIKTMSESLDNSGLNSCFQKNPSTRNTPSPRDIDCIGKYLMVFPGHYE